MVAQAIGQALGFAGSIGASLIGAHSAKKQRRFQRNMSNTAHQREMADLRKAGLNPLLTGKYGGSSTPSGTAFTPENPLKDAPQQSSAYASLKQSKPLITSQVLAVDAQTNQTNAQTEGIKIDNQQKIKSNPNVISQQLADIDKSKASSALSSKQINKINQELKHMREEFKKLQVTRKLWEAGGALTPQAQTIIQKANQIKQFFSITPKKTKSPTDFKSYKDWQNK